MMISDPPSPVQPSILVLDGDYPDMDGLVEKVLETFPLPWQGKRVLLKPNMLGPYPREKGITTHPSLIRSLVKALKKRGATCWVGDNPGLSGYAANERCARISGILEAADGGYVNFARETVQIPLKSPFLKKVVISRAVLDADLLINVPKFKTHVQTRITGRSRTCSGFWRERRKPGFTSPFPGQAIFRGLGGHLPGPGPDLTIMDAVVGMEGNGPSGKELRFIGKILASRNGVLMDGLMAAMMGIPAKDVDHLAVAGQRGLGEIDPAGMEIRVHGNP